MDPSCAESVLIIIVDLKRCKNESQRKHPSAAEVVVAAAESGRVKTVLRPNVFS